MASMSFRRFTILTLLFVAILTACWIFRFHIQKRAFETRELVSEDSKETYFSKIKDDRPHIVFLLADDLGFADVGYSGNTDIETPFLDYLSEQSLNLNFSYAQPVCSASRAALMTGRYPFRYGFQRSAINLEEPVGLDLDWKILPEALQELGYQTHLVGKWHLGHCKEDYTPLKRGFDSFKGFLGGSETYYSHTVQRFMHDYWDNTTINWDNVYSTDDYADHAVKLIYDNKDPRPMFLFLSSQAPHLPYDLPPNMPEDVDIDNKTLRYRYIVERLDRYARSVVEALKHNDMWDNTIFIFGSDNGGSSHGGSNYPLRGYKQWVFEGGTRVRTFIHGPGIDEGTYTGLFHITDWYPTLMEMLDAKIDFVKHEHADEKSERKTLDGVSQWSALKDNEGEFQHQPRQEFIYELNDKPRTEDKYPLRTEAMRVRYEEDGELRDYKYLLGTPIMGTFSKPYFKEAALFDMIKDPIEDEPILDGHEKLRDRIERTLAKERKRGYIPRVVHLDAKSNAITDRNGRLIVTHGWC